MPIPYDEIFLGLLLIYMGYSVYARLDARYPIAAALVLLIAAAASQAAGNSSAANALAVFVFFLLAGGVTLLLIEHARAERAARRAAEQESRALAPQAADVVSPTPEIERPEQEASPQRVRGSRNASTPANDTGGDGAPPTHPS